MPKDLLKLIKATKKKITALEQEQEKLFDHLALTLGIDVHDPYACEAKNWLFEAVYNTNDIQRFNSHMEKIARYTGLDSLKLLDS
jgi:hypothetical protein